MRALKVPIDVRQLDAALKSQPAAVGLRGKANLEALGRALGQELVLGGDTPLWDALTGTTSLVEHRLGGTKMPADGVVVVRTASPQRGGTAKFLLGLYEGLGSAGVPAVGVEQTDAADSATAVFRQAGLSTVDDVDTPVGRLALLLLLGGAAGAVRRQGLRGRRRAPAAAAQARRRGWLSRSSSSSRRGTRRRGSGRRSRRCGRRSPKPRWSSPTTAPATGRPAAARRAGARVVRLPRRGKGQALTLAEREAPPGPLLLCDADLEGDLAPLLDGETDLAIAAFASARAAASGSPSGRPSAGPSPQRLRGARAALGPARALPGGPRGVLPARPGLRLRGADDDRRRPRRPRVEERELPLRHRATGRDAGGFAHRGRQLLDARSPVARPRSTTAACACRSSARWSHSVAARPGACRVGVAAIALLGLADDLWSGPERGFRAHLARARPPAW